MSKFISRILLAVLVLCLAGCSWFSFGRKSDQEELADAPSMYQKAREQLDSENFEAAIKSYEQLEGRYPYGVYAQQAQLDVAYAYYRQGDQGSAIAACDRFIKLYPNHPKIDYAYYLKGLSLVGAGETNFFTGLLTPRQPLSERDPKSLEEAFDVFRYIVTKFPNGLYAADSQKHFRILTDALAAHELTAARYYLNRRAPLAAVNRAQKVIKTFPAAPSVEEALSIMAKGYDKLGLPDLRDYAIRVLRQNYPDSTYLK